MSSILDALKKAEQESTTDGGVDTPWPAPLAAKSSYRQRTRRWWVPLGVVVALCVSGAVFWKVRRPDTPRPAASVKAAAPSHKTDDYTPPPVAKGPKPKVTVAEQKRAHPAKTMIQATAPVVAVPSVQPEKKIPRTSTPAPAPMVKPSPLPLEKTQRPAAAPKPEPVIVSPATPVRRLAETAEAPGQTVAEPQDSGKVFRNDPRIDLQALVWSPEAAARFVVINNRLIKEGGSVDNIAVVRINPDDVLLDEGSDRWNEAFKVRN